jgi:NYN domain
MDIAFIDGENTKGRIRDVFLKYKFPVPEWNTYDFKRLFDEVFRLHPVSDRRFFRALPKHHPDIRKESEDLLLAYRNLGGHLHRQGFEVVKAGTLRADYRNEYDKKPRYREKGVDVSLAVAMVSLACDSKLETAYLIASDSDYQPAVAEVRKRNKKVVYVGFEVNPNLGLIAKTNDRLIISDVDVLRFGGVCLK